MLLPHIGEAPGSIQVVRKSSVSFSACCTVYVTRTHSGSEARGRVLTPVPVVHGRECLVRLMNGDHRSLIQNLQVLVGDDRGDLDDVVGVGLQTGHFQIYPDQSGRVAGGGTQGRIPVLNSPSR